jgi:hypothetical protein
MAKKKEALASPQRIRAPRKTEQRKENKKLR